MFEGGLFALGIVKLYYRYYRWQTEMAKWRALDGLLYSRRRACMWGHSAGWSAIGCVHLIRIPEGILELDRDMTLKCGTYSTHVIHTIDANGCAAACCNIGVRGE